MAREQRLREAIAGRAAAKLTRIATIAVGLSGALDAAGERTEQVMHKLEHMAARLTDALEAANERLAVLVGIPACDDVPEQSVREALAAAEEAAIQLVEVLE